MITIEDGEFRLKCDDSKCSRSIKTTRINRKNLSGWAIVNEKTYCPDYMPRKNESVKKKRN